MQYSQAILKIDELTDSNDIDQAAVDNAFEVLDIADDEGINIEHVALSVNEGIVITLSNEGLVAVIELSNDGNVDGYTRNVSAGESANITKSVADIETYIKDEVKPFLMGE